MHLSKSKPWTEEEVQLIKDKTKYGLTLQDVADKLGRTLVSVKNKSKRLSVASKTYNSLHLAPKYAANEEFLEKIQPSSILDAYAGDSYYKKKSDWCADRPVKIIDNDNEGTVTNYVWDAEKFLYQFRKKKFDFVDLDPFGSAFPCFDYALKIAQKGLAITFGEYGHRRFNRKDFVEHRYGIKTFEDFSVTNLTHYVVERGKIFNKVIRVEKEMLFINICRVYFTVENKEMPESGMLFFPRSTTLS